MNSFLPIANDEQWRRIRSTFSPAFSAAKLKEVIPLIGEATDILAKKLLAAANTGETSLLTFVEITLVPWFVCHEVIDVLADGKEIDVVYLDFAKAFDKVPP